MSAFPNYGNKFMELKGVPINTRTSDNVAATSTGANSNDCNTVEHNSTKFEDATKIIDAAITANADNEDSDNTTAVESFVKGIDLLREYITEDNENRDLTIIADKAFDSAFKAFDSATKWNEIQKEYHKVRADLAAKGLLPTYVDSNTDQTVGDKNVIGRPTDVDVKMPGVDNCVNKNSDNDNENNNN